RVSPQVPGAAAVALRQVDDAERDRQPGEQIGGPAWPQRQPADLRAAAADIEDQRIGLGLVEERRAAAERQPRLLRRRDDLDLQPRLAAHALEEVGAVVGATAGLGGN